MKITSYARLVVLAVILSLRVEAQICNFTTLAGSASSSGSVDGTGGNARFDGPHGVAVDSSGNVYVVDTGNDTIRKITPAGAVTTLAGSAGNSGSADATGGNARFDGPTGVAVDSAGNVYVADSFNDTIRKITPAGAVTTLAGSAGSSGSVDATGGNARFNFPSSVAVDSSGNVYVADSGNDTIRKITPAGAVTTLAGLAGSPGSANGTGGNARFNFPSGVAVDSSGNVYVADSGNDTIRKITSAGAATTLAGLAGSSGSVDATGGNARFDGPSGVAVDSAGNVYVADSNNSTIRKITSGGAVTTLAGSAGNSGSADGTGGNAQFNFPFGVAVGSSGNVYVADSDNSTIRKITSGGAVTTLAGSAGSSGSVDGTGGNARFNSPSGVAVDSAGNVYVADSGNDTIRKITPGVAVTTLAGSAGIPGSADGTGSNAQFTGPSGVAVDSSGNVYVADTFNDTIRKITPGGVVTTLAGSAGDPGSTDDTGTNAQFNGPSGVAVDNAGNVYVADTGNGTIRKISPAGVVTTLAGSAQFNGPSGVAVDNAGNVYVADTGNDTIRKISPAGAVTTLAGSAGVPGSADGTGVNAQFDGPSGVAVDGTGNVYVADTDNYTIRKITPAGVVTTLGGSAGDPGSADGLGGDAQFYFYLSSGGGVAVDGAGNVYVADSGNNTIRKGVPVTLSPFALWQISHFGSTTVANAQPTATPANDGIPNLIKYALGADPFTPSSTSLPVATVSIDPVYSQSHLTLTAILNSGATDVTISVEVSSDLLTWNSGTGYTEVVSDTTVNGVRTLIVHDTTPLGAGSRRFMHLKVTVP